MSLFVVPFQSAVARPQSYAVARVLVFMNQNKAHPRPDRNIKRPVHRIMHVVAIVAFQLATCKGSKIIDQV